ncbi:OLC1v1001484C1 [Oldenlandia corymbosa var. corymbosa]|uniref:OLC1v1001484C1 n=1 Tax=Oldenlandia corymbosa var. corymbosa TaxID=529605 RepID=A0AAV1D6Z1_OLDCO|nr:OLC1v1001484C1 [Oldenlandia corymbosa var. corymbosa]
MEQSANFPLKAADLEVIKQEQNPREGKESTTMEKNTCRRESWAAATEKAQEDNPWKKFDVGRMRRSGSNLEFIPPQEIEGRKVCQVQASKRQQGHGGEKIYRPVVIGRMNENIARKQQIWNNMFDQGSTSRNQKGEVVINEKEILQALDPNSGINE